MQYVLQNHQIALIRDEKRSAAVSHRLGDTMVFISSEYSRREMNDLLIGAILKSHVSLIKAEDDQRKLRYLESLAQAKLFDMLVVTNKSHTVATDGVDPELDHYIRYSHISVYHYLDGQYTGRSSQSHYLRNESINTVFQGIEDKLGALPHLKAACLLPDFEVLELPWVNNFKFGQPKGAGKPEDFHRGY